jgi:hypothetical protein
MTTYLARSTPSVVQPEPYPDWRQLGRSVPWQPLPRGFERVRDWRVRIGFHEAGHALILAAIGQPIDRVTIMTAAGLRRTGVGGRVRFVRKDHAPVSDLAFERAARADRKFVVAIAAGHVGGVMSEMILEGIMLFGAVAEIAGPDLDNALTFLRPLGVANGAGLHFAERYARAALTHHWPAVCRLAEGLLEHRVLPGHAVLELIGELPALPGVAPVPEPAQDTAPLEAEGV